jgi:hypothetical protein
MYFPRCQPFERIFLPPQYLILLPLLYCLYVLTESYLRAVAVSPGIFLTDLPACYPDTGKIVLASYLALQERPYTPAIS